MTVSPLIHDRDLHQSPEYGNYMERIGWRTILLKTSHDPVQMFVRTLGIGSVAKIQRASTMPDQDALERELAARRVFMCKVEPNFATDKNRMLTLKFHPDGSPLLGTRTLLINLQRPEKEIFSGFKKDARYCLRKAEALKPVIRVNEFDRFYEIWKKAAAKKRLWTPPLQDFMGMKESFGKKGFCITLNDTSGCMVLVPYRTAHYYYSGSMPEAKLQNLPYLSVWEAMKKAKKMGALQWDFEGIFDPRWPNSGWKGFTHFKKSFGGEEIVFPGCFTRWRWPW